MTSQLKYMTGAEFVSKIFAGERDFSGIKLEESFNLNNYEGFQALKSYLKKQDFRSNSIILSNSNLRGIKAEGLYLPFTNGKNIELDNADLRGSDFYAANFEDASFWETIFYKANLENSILRYARIDGANFVEANLKRADLRDIMVEAGDLVTYFRGTDLRDADLRNVDMNCGIIEFVEANLEGANLENAKFFKFLDFSYADLRRANMRGMQFWYANFDEADLREAENLDTIENLGSAIFNKTIVTQKEKGIIEAAIARSKEVLFDVKENDK